MDSSRGTTKTNNDSNMPQDPENWEQQENIKKTISSRKRPNVDATRAAGSPGKSAAMIQQASRNSAASTRNKETAKNQQAAEKAPVAGMAILTQGLSGKDACMLRNQGMEISVLGAKCIPDLFLHQ